MSNQKLTMGAFRELTRDVPDDAVLRYHGYDKGLCLFAYENVDVWMFPKGAVAAETKAVVINPGEGFDHRGWRKGKSDAVAQAAESEEEQVDETEDEDSYTIKRFFKDGRPPETIETGLTRKAAKEHCASPNTEGEEFFDGFSKE